MKIAKTIMNNERMDEWKTVPNFRLYFRSILVKPALYWHKNRHGYQWKPAVEE